jgi:putative N6-adenine-specific DNA methylase
MSYTRVPALLLRERFGFQRLPDYDEELWTQERNLARQMRREISPGLVSGSDLDPQAVAAARENLSLLPGGDRVHLQARDFRELRDLPNTTIVANPPYGIRMGDSAQVPRLYREFGDYLKRRCAGSTAYVYVGEKSLLKQVGLRPTERRLLVNGALEGRLCRFEIFAGRWNERVSTPRPK